MKFCLLTIGSGVTAADFAFFLTDPTQLEDMRRRFTLSPAEIAWINPNTKTAPVFRSRRDAELTASIYNRVPVLIEDGRDGGNPWRIQFRQGLFNMASDSALFRTAAQLAEEGFCREGADWVRDDVARYVPLYEAKMFNFYDHRFGDYASRGEDRGYRVMPETPLSCYQDFAFDPTPYYWVSTVDLNDRLSVGGAREWLLGFKDVTSATNERTAIFSIIPKVGVGHTAPLLFSDMEPSLLCGLYGNVNALSLDYTARTKVAGLHLTYGYLKQLAILPPSAYSEGDLAFIVPRVLELTYTSHSMGPFARDLGYKGAPFAWDEDRRAQLRAELDAWYALAYGLTRDELRYVLDPADVLGADYPSETFRILKSNEERKFGEYRTSRLVLAAYDELMAQGVRPRLEGYR